MNIENREKQALAIVLAAMIALAGLTGVFVWVGAQSFQSAEDVHLHD